MEYPYKIPFLVQLNALSTCPKHLDVQTLIYFESPNKLCAVSIRGYPRFLERIYIQIVTYS